MTSPAGTVAARSAFPPWTQFTPQERAERMTEAIADVAAGRDEDARILLLENGKIRLEAWIHALVFEIRWRVALDLVD